MHYRHLGLSICSTARLATLPVAPPCTSPDLRVIAGDEPPPDVAGLRWVAVDDEQIVSRASSEGGSWLRLRMSEDRKWVEFVIDPSGTTVWVWASAGAPWGEVAELLLGAVFSAILAQRGQTCLHAGVVQVSGRVIGVIGDKAAGKSTTCLALIAGGAIPVSDDVAVLRSDAGRPTVALGAPRLRVRRNTAELVLGSYDDLSPMWSVEAGRPEKRYYEVTRPPLPDWLALDALYLLVFDDTAAKPVLRTLSPVEALPRLMANRHVLDAIPDGNHARDFRVLAAAATAIPVRELARPMDVQGLAACVAAITNDLVDVA